MIKTLFGILLLVLPSPLFAGQSVTLAWNANSETNLAGYRLYWGPSNRTYTASQTVAATNTTATVTNLVIGERYFFAVTAFTVDGLESDFSDEVDFGFKPAKPANLRIQVSLQTAATLSGPWSNLWTLSQSQIPGSTSGGEFYRGLLTIEPLASD